jgi:hypothetical protein
MTKKDKRISKSEPEHVFSFPKITKSTQSLITVAGHIEIGSEMPGIPVRTGVTYPSGSLIFVFPILPENPIFANS